MKKDEKLALWSERIHDFQTSGQSCKAWCQENAFTRAISL